MKIFYLLLPLLLFSDNSSFITNSDYAKMLYNNPRGVSCAKCHGENGAGKQITSYINKNGDTVPIFAPSIKKISFAKFKKRLKNKKRYSLMPKYYYLTDSEIKTLYKYLRIK